MDAMPVEGVPSSAEFLSHVRAGWAAALGAFLAVFLPALVIAALLPPSYRAVATLAVLPAPEFTVRNDAGAHEPNTSTLAMDQIMKAETAILDADDLHAATLHKLGGAAIYPELFGAGPPDAVLRVLHGAASALLSPWRVTPADPAAALEQRALRAFESDLDLLPSKDANVITVSFDNPDGAVAAATVNTLLGVYAARRARLYEDPQLEVLRTSVAASEAAAAAADRRLAGYKRAHGISDYTQQRDILLRRLTQAEQDAAQAEAARAEQQARADALNRVLRSEPADVPAYRENDPDTRLQAVNASLADLRSRLAGTREKYLDSSRVVTSMIAQIAAQEQEAARLSQDRAASVVRQGRNPNIETLRLDRARAAAELAAAAARGDSARQQAASLGAALGQLDTAEAGLVDLQRQKDAANDDFRAGRRILAERHISESEDTLRLARVRVIQPALVPQKPRPLPLLVIGAGCVLGGLAAGLRICVGYSLHPVFLTSEGLESATGIPVLAVFRTSREVPEDTDLEIS